MSQTRPFLLLVFKKHQAPYSDSNFPTPPLHDELGSPTKILESQVAKAIRSFPHGSARDPEGIQFICLIFIIMLIKMLALLSIMVYKYFNRNF